MQVESKKRNPGSPQVETAKQIRSGLRGYGLMNVKMFHAHILDFLSGHFTPDLFVLMVVNRYWRDQVTAKLKANRVKRTVYIETASGTREFSELIPLFRHPFSQSKVFWKKLLSYASAMHAHSLSYKRLVQPGDWPVCLPPAEPPNRATYLELISNSANPYCIMEKFWAMLKNCSTQCLSLVKLNKIPSSYSPSQTMIRDMLIAQPDAMVARLVKGHFIGWHMLNFPDAFIGITMPNMKSAIRLWLTAVLYGTDTLANHYWCAIREGTEYLDINLAWEEANNAVGLWERKSEDDRVALGLAPLIVASFNPTCGQYLLTKPVKQLIAQYSFWSRVHGLVSLVITHGISTPLKEHGITWAKRNAVY